MVRDAQDGHPGASGELDRQLLSRLPGPVSEVLAECHRKPKKDARELRRALEAYSTQLQEHAGAAEFLDSRTAGMALRGCLRLLDRLPGTGDPARARLTQGAIEYFALARDAEFDLSIVGFDDDWLVVRTTAEVLGIDLGAVEDG